VKIASTFIACFLLLAVGYGQEKTELPRYVAPTELTILKHNFGSERRFVTESTPQSARGGEPATRVVSQPVTTVSVRVKNKATKTIVGVSWYFVLARNSSEDYFSLPFVTPTDISPQDTRTLKAQIERLPGRARAITVDELKHPDKNRAQERIVITCVLFSDGTSSPLNEASQRDCRRMEISPEIKRKIEKL